MENKIENDVYENLKKKLSNSDKGSDAKALAEAISILSKVDSEYEAKMRELKLREDQLANESEARFKELELREIEIENEEAYRANDLRMQHKRNKSTFWGTVCGGLIGVGGSILVCLLNGRTDMRYLNRVIHAEKVDHDIVRNNYGKRGRKY